mmetsp:Transcript_8258/g.30194  ORF Transcript_8258/g.30194 Transcript_8258/m.30194 type:complete len:215 (+) Transcript_8258:623-1267(+)
MIMKSRREAILRLRVEIDPRRTNAGVPSPHPSPGPGVVSSPPALLLLLPHAHAQELIHHVRVRGVRLHPATAASCTAGAAAKLFFAQLRVGRAGALRASDVRLLLLLPLVPAPLALRKPPLRVRHRPGVLGVEPLRVDDLPLPSLPSRRALAAAAAAVWYPRAADPDPAARRFPPAAPARATTPQSPMMTSPDVSPLLLPHASTAFTTLYPSTT